jgi:putative ubiquitin-RnfH superfamily antitoxin RatB of RatAB toxin-antitoxin module
MRVEAILALQARQISVVLELAAGATVEDGVRAAQQVDAMTGFDLTDYATGVYGQVCEGDRVLLDGDRLEFYRPLLIDAKARRRALAQEQSRSRAANKQQRQQQAQRKVKADPKRS